MKASRNLTPPTQEEDRAITAAALGNPDARPLTGAQLATSALAKPRASIPWPQPHGYIASACLTKNIGEQAAHKKMANAIGRSSAGPPAQKNGQLNRPLLRARRKYPVSHHTPAKPYIGVANRNRSGIGRTGWRDA